MDAAGLESAYLEEHWSSSCSLIIAIREMSLIYKLKRVRKKTLQGLGWSYRISDTKILT